MQTYSLKQNQQFSFNPELVDNGFIAESNTVALSNFDLLKELSFINKHRRERRDGLTLRRLTTAPIEKTLSNRIQYIVGNVPCGKVAKRLTRVELLPSSKLLQVAKNQRSSQKIQKKWRKPKDVGANEAGSRLKMKEIREIMKKNSSLGIYNVPFPNQADISDE